MATYQQWSQSYFTNLTPDQHDANNNWFQSMRDRLTDSEIKERVECYDDELYDELVDNVISNPTPVINNQGGQS